MLEVKRTKRIGKSNTWIFEGKTTDGTLYTIETAYRGEDGKPMINTPDENSAWWDTKEEMFADTDTEE